AKARGVAPSCDVSRDARFFHQRLGEKRLVYHISPAALAHNSLGLIPQIGDKLVDVFMYLDVNLAVQHTNLHRLVDEFPGTADADHVEKLLDVLGVETNTAVGYQPPN